MPQLALDRGWKAATPAHCGIAVNGGETTEAGQAAAVQRQFKSVEDALSRFDGNELASYNAQRALVFTTCCSTPRVPAATPSRGRSHEGPRPHTRAGRGGRRHACGQPCPGRQVAVRSDGADPKQDLERGGRAPLAQRSGRRLVRRHRRHRLVGQSLRRAGGAQADRCAATRIGRRRQETHRMDWRRRTGRSTADRAFPPRQPFKAVGILGDRLWLAGTGARPEDALYDYWSRPSLRPGVPDSWSVHPLGETYFWIKLEGDKPVIAAVERGLARDLDARLRDDFGRYAADHARRSWNARTRWENVAVAEAAGGHSRARRWTRPCWKSAPPRNASPRPTPSCSAPCSANDAPPRRCRPSGCYKAC